MNECFSRFRFYISSLAHIFLSLFASPKILTGLDMNEIMNLSSILVMAHNPYFQASLWRKRFGSRQSAPDPRSLARSGTGWVGEEHRGR